MDRARGRDRVGASDPAARAPPGDVARDGARSPPATRPGCGTHLERAVQLATESGLPAARCEALARLALEASRLGAEAEDAELLDAAEQAAIEAAELAATMPGHPPWGAEASASLARIALARGRTGRGRRPRPLRARGAAAGPARGRAPGHRVPVANALAAYPEWEELRPYLQQTLAMIAQRTVDEDVRVRWFRSPIGRELTRLVGPVDQCRPPTASSRRAWTGAAAQEPDARARRTARSPRSSASRNLRSTAARRAVRADRRDLARRGHRVRVPGACPVRG